MHEVKLHSLHYMINCNISCNPAKLAGGLYHDTGVETAGEILYGHCAEVRTSRPCIAKPRPPLSYCCNVICSLVHATCILLLLLLQLVQGSAVMESPAGDPHHRHGGTVAVLCSVLPASSLSPPCLLRLSPHYS